MIQWNAERILRRVDHLVQMEVREGAEDVLKMAQANCPEDDGDLKSSGRIVEWNKGGMIGAYVKFGDNDKDGAYYAPFVELGTPGTTYKTKGMRGKKRKAVKKKPFLRPAYKRYRRTYRKRLKAALS